MLARGVGLRGGRVALVGFFPVEAEAGRERALESVDFGEGLLDLLGPGGFGLLGAGDGDVDLVAFFKLMGLDEGVGEEDG